MIILDASVPVFFNSTGTRKVNDVTSDFTRRAIEAERTGNYQLRVGNLNTKRAIMDQRILFRHFYYCLRKVMREMYIIYRQNISIAWMIL